MCAYILAFYANCRKNHFENLRHCTLKHKAKVNAQKKIAKKTLEKDKAMVDNRKVEVENEVINSNLNPRIDLRINH